MVMLDDQKPLLISTHTGRWYFLADTGKQRLVSSPGGEILQHLKKEGAESRRPHGFGPYQQGTQLFH
eukprot:145404-Pelagomonas_calceolata.AAC.1